MGNYYAGGLISSAVVPPSQVPGTSVTIAGCSTPTQVYGAAGQPFVTVGTFTLKGNSVAPDSLLEFSGLFNFLTPNIAGRKVQVTIGGTLVSQAFPTGSLGGITWKFLIWVAPDLKSIDVFSQNLNDVISPTNGQGAPFSSHTNTKTTISIDLTQDQTVNIQVGPTSGETHELSAWSLVNHRYAATPTRSHAPANALACWGDSLTAGTGSVSPTGGWVSQLRIAKAGQVVINLGVGGQTSAQIAARVVADTVRGKYWNCVFWMGRNDVGNASLTSVVTGNLATAVANLAAGVKYIVCTVIPAANEGVGSANWNAIVALNTAVKSTYGSKVADVFSALTSNGTVQIPIADRNVTASTTATWTNGSNQISVTSATGLAIGQYITGTGIPDQTTITGISGTTITLSANTTAGGSGTAVSAVASTEVHLNDTGYGVVESTIATVMGNLGM